MLAIISLIITFTDISFAELTINYPEEVKIEEEFLVSIDSDISETQDVKIFVHNSEDQKVERSEYISEIFEENWKDPWFYLTSAFPEKKEFKIKVLDSPGERIICAKLRKAETKSIAEKCATIKVIGEAEKEEPEEEEDEEENNEIVTEKIEFPIEEVSQIVQNEYKQQEKIVLSSPKKEQTIIVTKQEKRRTGIIYTFIGLCVLITILAVMKKL